MEWSSNYYYDRNDNETDFIASPPPLEKTRLRLMN